MMVWRLFDRSVEFGLDCIDQLSQSLFDDPRASAGCRDSWASTGRTWTRGEPCRPAEWRRAGCFTGMRPVYRDRHPIPPPCWAPLPLGEVFSFGCPGGTVTIRLVITNDGPSARTFRIDTGTAVPGIGISAPAITLASMERGSVAVSYQLPANAGIGQEFEILVWVRGCRNYYLRWVARAAQGCSGSCHEVEVCDGPDPVHHWYDHFYCAHPCANPSNGNAA